MSPKDDYQVVTPGGPRRKSLVHRVESGQTVRDEGELARSNASDDPAGMRPVGDMDAESGVPHRNRHRPQRIFPPACAVAALADASASPRYTAPLAVFTVLRSSR
jgi:hypothetical protein